MAKALYVLTHPSVTLSVVTGALLVPILVLVVLTLGYVLFEFARFTVETLPRARRRRRLSRLEEAAAEARARVEAGDPEGAASVLAKAGRDCLLGRFARRLPAGSATFERRRVLKQVAEVRAYAAKRLDRTRVIARLGPVLGLMGALILVAQPPARLVRGASMALTANLVVALSVIVVSLFIGALAYVMSTARDRHYAQDVDDIEYVLDIMGV